MPAGIDVSLVHGVHLVTFDASRLGVWSDPIDAGSAVPHTPGEALSLSGADAVLDGPMFANCSSSTYAGSSCAVVRFEQYDAGRGTSFTGSSSGDGLTIALVDGRAVASDGASIPEGASVAIQCYPALVRNGQVVASNGPGTNGNAEQRAAVCIMSDGRVALATGAMDMVSFATVLAAVGAVDAGYTDGGGSTALWLSDGQRFGASEQRKVATWVVAGPASDLASLVPSGVGGWAAAAAGVTALGLIGWTWWDSRRRTRR